MPEFVEWLMGFPIGWTEGPARTNRLRMLGNAVVPRQGHLAILLLSQDLLPLDDLSEVPS